MFTEWKKVCKSRWLKIVLIAIIVIPSVYAGVFLGSMWDPYGKSEEIPVAVINEDVAVEYQGKKLDVGKQLSDNLMKNTAMKFVMCDEAKALAGIQEGSYYMVVTIPSDFSKNATTVLDHQPKKMQLQYTTNPGTNYIATKMDDSAMQKIKDEVSSIVTKTYTETIFSQIDTMHQGLSNASDGSLQLTQGLDTALQGNGTLHSNLKTLSEKTFTFEKGTASFQEGVHNYVKGVADVADGAKDVHGGLVTLQGSTKRFTDGASDLSEGATSLNTGLDTYTKGVHTVNENVSILSNNSIKIKEGMQKTSTALDNLQSGTTGVLDGLSQLSKQLTDSLKQQAPVIQEVQKENLASEQALQDLIQEAKALHETVATLQAQKEQRIAKYKEIQTDDERSKDIIAQLIEEENQVDYTPLLQTLSTVKNDAQLSSLISKDTQVINSLSDGMKQISQSLDKTGDTPTSMGLLQGMKSVTSGLDQLKNSYSSTGGFVDQVQQYTNGVDAIFKGTAKLDERSTDLSTGASTLDAGLNTLYGQTPALTKGIYQLTSGSNTLAKGTLKLNNQASSMIGSIDTIHDAASQLYAGSTQLSDGSYRLATGLQQCYDGSSTLSNKLDAGANNSSVSTTNQTIEMFASPVILSQTQLSKVENNGHAMAPYMMSVGLYVACMAFTLMYPLLKNHRKTSSGVRLWLDKASVMYIISTLMAVLMVSSLIWMNGMMPIEKLQTYLMAILISAAFMSMIVFFNITCGKIGSFLVLVFMVFQLGGAAGTYPIETSGVLYQRIHPYMPFTYSVDAFRHSISIGQVVVQDVAVFVVMIVIFSALSIWFYHYKQIIGEEKYQQSVFATFQE